VEWDCALERSGKSNLNSVSGVVNALMEKRRPFLDIGVIPEELKKMIAGCWKEEGKDRPEFVSLYRDLCVGEFEEMSSHLEQLSPGGLLAYSSTPTSSQGNDQN